ncbi:LAME_0H02454g1_1 [Lachancea meyersii CBS 8951]|uniref:LAME_0H02454g1_1 n=1 Tax=Lachancea meyersii CBS 8951 TaxID=1266667 RepID=A0A1G4KDD9_9SACH|nr:LAME_0H02454g1_1 [Lachancea meyersii CBS 8951]
MIQVGHQARIGRFTGTVKFVGETEFAKGVWCGIELNDKSGKNDGSVNGIRYFETVKKGGFYGLFARLEAVHAVGEDFQDEETPIDGESSVKLRNLVVRLQDKLYEIHSRYKELELKVQRSRHLELELEACVMDKEAQQLEIEELADELARLKKKHKDSLSHIHELDEEINLRRSIDLEEWNAQASSETLWKRNKLLESTLFKLQSALENSRQRNEELGKQNEVITREHRTVRDELENVSQELEDCRRLIENLSSQLESEVSYDHIVDKLTQENADLQTQVEEYKMITEELQAECVIARDLEHIYRDLEEELSEQLRWLREDLKTAQQKMNDLEFENSELSQKLTARDPSVERQFQELTTQIDELQLSLRLKSRDNQFLMEGLDDINLRHPMLVSRQFNFLSRFLGEGTPVGCTKGLKASFLLELAAQFYMSTARTNKLTKSNASDLQFFTADQIEGWKNTIIRNEFPDELLTLGMRPYLDLRDSISSTDALILFQTLQKASTDLLSSGRDFVGALRLSLSQLIALCDTKLESVPEGAMAFVEKHQVFDLLASFFEQVICCLDFDDIEQGKMLNSMENLLSTVRQLEVIVKFDHDQDQSEGLQNHTKTEAPGKTNESELKLLEMRDVISAKQSSIEELTLKLKFFENKLERQKLQEDVVFKLQTELSALKSSEKLLQSSVRSLEAANLGMQENLDVERIKHRFLFPTEKLVNLAKETDGVDRFKLTCQINDLKAVISSRQDTQDVLNENLWLETPLCSKDAFVGTNFFNELELARNNYSQFLETADVVPITLGSYKSSSLGYFCRRLDEKKALLESQLYKLSDM